MHRSVAWARERGGVGVWFPSPSEYDGTAFISSLSTMFALEIEERGRRSSKLTYVPTRRPSLAAAAGLVSFGVFNGLLLATTNLAPYDAIVAAAGPATFVVALAYLWTRIFKASRRAGRLELEATRVREHARFALTQKTGTQMRPPAGEGSPAASRARSTASSSSDPRRSAR